MPPKLMSWYWQQYALACSLACLYGVELSLEQFCASRLLEQPEFEELAERFAVLDGCK